MSHPILDATASVQVALKSVYEVNPTFMSTDEKATALRELVRAESQLAELRMRVLAAAGDVAERTAAHDAADWLAAASHVRHEEARAELALAVGLDGRWSVLAAGLRTGDITVAQAEVIARALAALPRDIGPDALVRAEETLVEYAADFGPRQLARLGRRILDIVAPDLADVAEARRLAELESDANRRTRLTLRRRGDGTTLLGGVLPDPVADRLATYLEAYTNPRKEPVAGADRVERLTYPRRLGEAFCQLLEAVDPNRLPMHGGDATTVVVSVSLDALRSELATAELLGVGHVPGDDSPSLLTASEARRLACTARIVPAVLGGPSEILDLGRTQRLFSAPQRKALLIRDRECRAESCTIPGTWCEAHHWLAWSSGGRTDLKDGVLLCHHHHQRAHDAGFTAARMPNGDVRFRRRT